MTHTPPEDRPPKLSSLSRFRADENDRKQIFNSLQQESDRGVALIVAAELDNALEDAILVDWDHLNAEEINLLFEGNAPLASLAAKIRVGYAMYLYGEITSSDLLVIAKIRNAFAHSPKPLDFSHVSIAEACKMLRVPHAYSIAGIIDSGMGFNSHQGPAREVFIAVCYMISEALTSRSTKELKRKLRMVKAIMAPLEAGVETASQVNARLEKYNYRKIP